MIKWMLIALIYVLSGMIAFILAMESFENEPGKHARVVLASLFWWFTIFWMLTLKDEPEPEPEPEPKEKLRVNKIRR